MSYSNFSTTSTILELKKHPEEVLEITEEGALVVLSKDEEPLCYCISPIVYEALINKFGDLYLMQFDKKTNLEK